jgi:hypothetical protein
MGERAATSLLIDPARGVVASADLQRQVGGDPAAALRFPPRATSPTVTPGMGVFTVTAAQLEALVDRAQAPQPVVLAVSAA